MAVIIIANVFIKIFYLGEIDLVRVFLVNVTCWVLLSKRVREAGTREEFVKMRK